MAKGELLAKQGMKNDEKVLEVLEGSWEGMEA